MQGACCVFPFQRKTSLLHSSSAADSSLSINPLGLSINPLALDLY